MWKLPKKLVNFICWQENLSIIYILLLTYVLVSVSFLRDNLFVFFHNCTIDKSIDLVSQVLFLDPTVNKVKKIENEK